MSKPADALAVGAAIFFPSLVTLVYFVWLDDYTTAKQIAYGAGKLLQFAFPLAWVVLVRRQFGKWERPATQGIGLGLAFGALVAAAMFGLYWIWLKPSGLFSGVREEVVSKIDGFGITQLWQYAALGVFYSLGHSLLEEYYWRWFVFGRSLKLMPLAGAVTLSSLGFMAHHVILLAVYFGWTSPATYLFSAAIAVGGAIWALLYGRSNSLVGPWLSHMLVDAAIFTIGFDLARDLFA